MICPLCKFSVSPPSSDPNTEVMYFICESCGKFGIERSSYEDLPSEKFLADKLYIISGLTRQASDQGEKIILSLYKMKSGIEGVPIPSNIYDSMYLLLAYIKNNSKKYGQYVTLNLRDYPIVFGKDMDEFQYLVYMLRENGYINKSGSNNFQLTLEGLKKYEELRINKNLSRQAFVAMWFDVQTEEAWEVGFKIAINDSGYNPVRVDLIEHNGKICDRIIAEIRRSGLFIADFTGNRGGVYFEAGFALGLGIPVIWTCRNDFVDELHFDTRQYNHIIWENALELQEKLRDRIIATVITA